MESGRIAVCLYRIVRKSIKIQRTLMVRNRAIPEIYTFKKGTPNFDESRGLLGEDEERPISRKGRGISSFKKGSQTPLLTMILMHFYFLTHADTLLSPSIQSQLPNVFQPIAIITTNKFSTKMLNKCTLNHYTNRIAISGHKFI